MEARSPRTWAHARSHSLTHAPARKRGPAHGGCPSSGPARRGGTGTVARLGVGAGPASYSNTCPRTARRRWPFTRSRAPLTVASLPLRRGPRVKAGQACGHQRTWSPLRIPRSSLSDRADGTSQVPNRPMRSHSHATCDKGEMRGSGRGFLKQRMSVRSVSGVS